MFGICSEQIDINTGVLPIYKYLNILKVDIFLKPKQRWYRVPGMVGNTYRGESFRSSRPALTTSEFKASPRYMRTCLKKYTK